MATPADHLLAMKILAGRSTSGREDCVRLIDYLYVSTRQQAWDIVGRFFPDIRIPQRSKRVVEDLIGH